MEMGGPAGTQKATQQLPQGRTGRELQEQAKCWCLGQVGGGRAQWRVWVVRMCGEASRWMVSHQRHEYDLMWIRQRKMSLGGQRAGAGGQEGN